MLHAVQVAAGSVVILAFLFVQTRNLPELALEVLGVGFLVGTVYFVMWTNLNKFLAGTQSVRGSSSGSQSLQHQLDSTPESVEEYKYLLALPRPRPVRLTQSAKQTLQGTYIAVGVLAIVMVLVISPWLFVDDPSVTRNIHTFLFIMGSVVLAFAGLIGCKFRGKALVANGEIGIAKVVDQQLSRSSRYSGGQFAIRYEFTDAYGHRHSRFVFDRTNSLYEGMTVPVFYDSKRSASQIAACEAMFEVILPVAGIHSAAPTLSGSALSPRT